MSIDLQPSIGLKDAIVQRRAARAFAPNPISIAILEEVLRLGTQAPSGYNLQPWRFIVLRDQQSRDKLKACAFNQRQIGEAPVVLICCGDRMVSQPDYIESVIKLAEATDAMTEQYADFLRNQIPALFENSPSFGSVEAWTNRHTMLAVAHLMIAAKSFGVDSCPMEGFVTAQVKVAFEIPETVDVCCILCLGYAAEPFKAYGGRFDLDRVYYGETYGKPFILEAR